jgi:hypothetical protein
MKKQILAAMSGVVLAVSLSAGAQVVVHIGPPAPVIERPGPVPHEGWVWQPGYHRWDGAHYVWVPGTYVQPPYEHAAWVPGHWAHRGGGWVWIDGHWRR